MDMFPITKADIQKIVGGSAPLAAEMLPAINQYCPLFGIVTPVRLAGFLGAFLGHESRFVYRGEVWGPTPAQKRYEGRRDLGNTHPGDGYKYRGFGGGQVTGRANVVEFYFWCVKTFPEVKIPNFIDRPDTIGTGPWWVISAIWFWHTRKLNNLADKVQLAGISDNIKPLVKKINGGYNGLKDRVECTTRGIKLLQSRQPYQGTQEPSGRAASSKGTVPLVDGMAPATDQRGEDMEAPAPVEATIINKETIQAVQQMLFKKGYTLVGEDDGDWGRKTRNAVLAFRVDNGLPTAFDADENGRIDAAEAIDATFMAKLMAAPPLAEGVARATKPTADVAALVPEVAEARKGKFAAIATTVGAAVPGIGGGISAVLKGFPDARAQVQPFFDAISFEIPTWAWFFILAGVSATTWYLAHRSQKAGVEAYRAGERLAQSGE